MPRKLKIEIHKIITHVSYIDMKLERTQLGRFLEHFNWGCYEYGAQ
jgi:hypothetical protein